MTQQEYDTMRAEERKVSISRRWTVAEIAARNEETGGHYFDRGTLRFFGQRRGDFRVYQGGGRVFVFAAAHRGWNSSLLSSFAEFKPVTGDVSSVPREGGDCWTLAGAKAFVAALRA